MRKLFLAMALAATFATPAFATQYQTTIIGGPNTSGGALNEAGHVVFDQGSSALLFNGSQAINLGSLGGSVTRASDVNNLDQVAGYSAIAGWPGYTHAFVYSGGTMSDLGTLGGKTSAASAINDSGMVAGYSDLPGSGTHAFVYSQAGGMKDLGTLGGDYSMASDINAKGDIVGYSKDAAGKEHTFFYSNGVMSNLDTQFGLGSTSDGHLITTTLLSHVRFGNNGAIIGDIMSLLSDPDGMVYDYWYQAAMYDNGTLTKLPAYYIGDVNAAGAVLTNNDYQGAALTVNGVKTNLNQLTGRPDLDVWGAYQLNAEGEILAYGENANHEQVTMLLTPVPEPETWAMLLGGLAMLGWTKRRRRA